MESAAVLALVVLAVPARRVPAPVSVPETTRADDDDWPEPDDDDGWTDPWDEAELRCGEMAVGGCSLVGTEHCDFRCPFRDGMIRNLERREARRG